MSVYHCPLCPLIFEYRTEVEWHLGHEHRTRVEEDAEPATRIGRCFAGAQLGCARRPQILGWRDGRVARTRYHPGVDHDRT